jgi:hypothetical protein
MRGGLSLTRGEHREIMGLPDEEIWCSVVEALWPTTTAVAFKDKVISVVTHITMFSCEHYLSGPRRFRLCQQLPVA